MHPTAPAHLPDNLYLETAAGSKGLSEQQKLNSEVNFKHFPPVSADPRSYLANVLLTSLLDSATSQLLQEIHAPRINTGLTLEGQEHPGMLQRCSSQSHVVPVATLSNTNTEPTNRNPSPVPLPDPCTAEGLCPPWTWRPLACSFFLHFVSFHLLSPKGFLLHFCICFILNANGKFRETGSEMELSAFNCFPDAGSSCTI